MSALHAPAHTPAAMAARVLFARSAAEAWGRAGDPATAAAIHAVADHLEVRAIAASAPGGSRRWGGTAPAFLTIPERPAHDA